jgi:GTP cyclohydrolase I
MRGVKKHGISTATTQFSGLFRQDFNQQVRFLTLLRAAR